MELVWYSSPQTHVGGKTTVEVERHLTEPVRFYVNDDKGREIGAYAVIERNVHWSNGVPTFFHSYRVSTRATRGGVTFGAIPRYSLVMSVEEGKALAVKKIEEARKRVMKKVAKGAALKEV